MKALGEVKQGKGNLTSILNSSFGLIRFGDSFCLFDTYDLFLETGKTAAQSRLTATNCLTVGMEVWTWFQSQKHYSRHIDSYFWCRCISMQLNWKEEAEWGGKEREGEEEEEEEEEEERLEKRGCYSEV